MTEVKRQALSLFASSLSYEKNYCTKVIQLNDEQVMSVSEPIRTAF